MREPPGKQQLQDALRERFGRYVIVREDESSAGYCVIRAVVDMGNVHTQWLRVGWREMEQADDVSQLCIDKIVATFGECDDRLAAKWVTTDARCAPMEPWDVAWRGYMHEIAETVLPAREIQNAYSLQSVVEAVKRLAAKCPK